MEAPPSFLFKTWVTKPRWMWLGFLEIVALREFPFALAARVAHSLWRTRARS